MAFSYKLKEISDEIENFVEFESDLPIARKLAILNERAIELTAYWSTLPLEQREAEATPYYAELTKVMQYNRLCIDNLLAVIDSQKSKEQKAEAMELEADKKDELVMPKLNVPYLEFHVKFQHFCEMSPIQMGSVDQIKVLRQGLKDLLQFMGDNGANNFIPGVVLTSLVHSKLDRASRVSFALWFRGNENPTVDEVISYFDFLIESMGADPANSAGPSGAVNRSRSTSRAKVASEPSAVKKAMRTSCAQCGINHPLHRCVQFKTSTYNARCRTLNRAGLCYNCFSMGHNAAECPDAGCERCHTKHNSIMCKAHWDKEQPRET